MEDVHKRGKLPIVVGGTYHYIEAILLKDYINYERHTDENTNEEADLRKTIEEEKNRQLPIYDILCRVDPVMAEKLHPNDLRKIERSLEVNLMSINPHSEDHPTDWHSTQPNSCRAVGESSRCSHLLESMNSDLTV